MSGRSGAFAANDGSVRELQTPYGKLAVAGASYSAEICEAVAAPITPARRVSRIAVDQGVVVFDGESIPVAITV